MQLRCICTARTKGLPASVFLWGFSILWGAVYKWNILEHETQLCAKWPTISSCLSPGPPHFVTGGCPRAKQQPGWVQGGVRGQVGTAHGAQESSREVLSFLQAAVSQAPHSWVCFHHPKRHSAKVPWEHGVGILLHRSQCKKPSAIINSLF